MATSDPVAKARKQLAAAEETKQGAAQALEDLETRIAGGDLTVSADQHAQAEHAAKHAKLIAQGAAQALADAEKAERLRKIAEVRARALAPDGIADDGADKEDREQIAAAVARIAQRHGKQQQEIGRLIAELSRLGVPANSKAYQPQEHGGMSWAPAMMGLPDRIIVDGKAIAASNPTGLIIGEALAAGCGKAGLNVNWLRPVVAVNVKQARPR